MKFILYVEDEGYAIRYWDEIQETVGATIAHSWRKDKLYKLLTNTGFQITEKELGRAIKILDEKSKPFVVLTSKKKGMDLDTFLNDLFVIDEELTNGDE
jgi:hypothetical protein